LRVGVRADLPEMDTSGARWLLTGATLRRPSDALHHREPIVPTYHFAPLARLAGVASGKEVRGSPVVP
jgi:hypothetical protein